jgi:hypothetical protein
MQNKKWKLIKWGTGLLSLYLDARLRKRRKHRSLDIVLIDAFMHCFLSSPDLESFSLAERKRYETAVDQTIYWHGTGRLQHDSKGGIVDVLDRLLKQQGLRPFRDVFDAKHGEMFSTSVARQRMYARIYADMHEYGGANLRQRYGSPRFWAYYFIMAINLHATKELGLWNPKTRREQHAAWRKLGKEVWAVKVHRNPGEATGKFFDNGSDIIGNYPILIGIKSDDYILLETADYVARYESRIGSPIPVDAFTHLEVPDAKIAEVKALLKKHGHGDLPVVSFEKCEHLAATRYFSALVS